MVLRLIGFLFIFLSLSNAHADVLFEGYSIVRLSGVHVGYTIQRYEFDAKSKQFSVIYFLKTNSVGGNITESLKALANDKFQPLAYQYTNQTGDKTTLIDATFKGDIMNATVSDGKAANKVSKKLTKGTFLASFLGYLMLQNGYKVGKKFTYSAIAEEQVEAFSGEAYIKEEQDYAGNMAFRILNSFAGVKFVSFVTPKGEILGTTQPESNISTDLVASPELATQGHLVPNKAITLLFGSMPTGQQNILAQKAQAKTTPPTITTAPPPPAAAPAPTPTESPTPKKEKAKTGP